MNTDANPFAGYEPNTTAGTEDLGGDFDLAGAAGRAARTGSIITIPTTMAKTGEEPTQTHVQS